MVVPYEREGDVKRSAGIKFATYQKRKSHRRKLYAVLIFILKHQSEASSSLQELRQS